MRSRTRLCELIQLQCWFHLHGSIILIKPRPSKSMENQQTLQNTLADLFPERVEGSSICPGPSSSKIESSGGEKQKLPQSVGRKKKRFNKSLWTLQENLKYIRFLQQNRELFESTKQNRRLLKINKLISLSIKTRSPDQCRSHHQKMVKYHESIMGIITHVHLLRNLQIDDAELADNDGRVALRIRKRASKGEAEPATSNEDSEKGLWDVLCMEENHLPSFEQNLQYM